MPTMQRVVSGILAVMAILVGLALGVAGVKHAFFAATPEGQAVILQKEQLANNSELIELEKLRIKLAGKLTDAGRHQEAQQVLNAQTGLMRKPLIGAFD